MNNAENLRGSWKCCGKCAWTSITRLEEVPRLDVHADRIKSVVSDITVGRSCGMADRTQQVIVKRVSSRRQLGVGARIDL